MTRVLNLATRITFLIALLALTVWTIYEPTLTEANKRREEAITRVVPKGPVDIEGSEWTLESMQVYTRLVDDQRKPVSLDVPAGASIVVAVVAIKPLVGLNMDDGGFSCDAELVDNQNNFWKEQSSVYGLSMPTYCSDDDHPFTRGKANKVMKVFVIPTAAVPNILGVVSPATGKAYPKDRVLITT
jgi:hypothetical protein